MYILLSPRWTLTSCACPAHFLRPTGSHRQLSRPDPLPRPCARRREAISLSMAQLPEEVCQERRAGAAPQHAPEEPEQAPDGALESLLSQRPSSALCKTSGFCPPASFFWFYFVLFLVQSAPGDPLCTRGGTSDYWLC